eukprot:m.714536 g.714536  ORF g.714536 m.714536 type:complete len:137 (+) comp58783_c0_seq63:237-647(+)
MLEVLRALDFAHSRGIIHRDIKPNNIMLSLDTNEVTIIDWGLAEFFHSERELSARVATLPYKPPEILLGSTTYDYSFDMWSFGCIFASLVLQREILFRGCDHTDQLAQIARVLGLPELLQLVHFLSLQIVNERLWG